MVILNNSLLLGIDTLKSWVSYLGDLLILVKDISRVLGHPCLYHHWHNLLDCTIWTVVQRLDGMGGIGLQQMRNDSILSVEVIDL